MALVHRPGVRATGRWMTRWRRALPAAGDVGGAFNAAVVMLAVEGSFGIVALAPLGPGYASLGFLLGVWSSALSNLVAVPAGARGPLLGGPSAALALLVAPLLATLLADPRLTLPDGRPDTMLMLAFAAAGVLLAGIAQVVLATLRLGAIVRYVPYPVHAGFMNGVAVLMVLAMLPHALGLAGDALGQTWRDARPLALVVTACALAVSLVTPRWSRRLPAYLLALLAATALHHALQAIAGPARLGPLLGDLRFDWPWRDAGLPLAHPALGGLLADKLPLLLQFAAVLTLTSSMQTLMASSVVDSLTRTRRDGERMLRAQGAANVATGVLGLLPTAGAVSNSSFSLGAGARGSVSRPLYALALLLLLALGTPVMREVPMAAIAGVFMAGGFTLVDRWSRRATPLLAGALLRGRAPPRSLALPYAVMLLVAATAVGVSLTVGVAVGVVAAMAMFIRSNIRAPVRSASNGALRRSRKVRPPEADALLAAHGTRIAVLEFEGALFFGTADAAAREIERLAPPCDQVVVDLRRVSEIDASGARLLLQCGALLHAQGKRLLFAGLAPGDARTHALRDMDLGVELSDADFFPDLDRALESAEDTLLAALGAVDPDTPSLTLAQTLLGAALDRDELDALAACLVERRVPRGEAVFRQGDPGDALYVALRGRIGIWLPDASGASPWRRRRLVSYAPGVPFGEIGVLRGTPRTADAIAEDDAVVLELSRERLERLAEAQPRLHGKLLRLLGCNLAARLGALTQELRSLDGP